MTLASLRSPLSGRRIAARAGASPSRTNTVLTELAEAGVVRVTQARPAFLYELNRSHVLTGVVEELLGLRKRMRERLVDTLAEWELAPHAAVLFGSTALGAAGSDSDIDLLLLRPDDVAPDDETWTRQIADLNVIVRGCTGNDLDVIDLDNSELASNERLLRDITRTGDVLFGRLTAPGDSAT